jgi:predicted esterase
VAQARAASEALRAAGAEVDYHEYEVGHKMSAEGMRAMKGWVEGVIGIW